MIRINLSAAFSFGIVGAKEKAIKKKSAEAFVSRSEEREEGYAPSTTPPFEKGGRKLSYFGFLKGHNYA